MNFTRPLLSRVNYSVHTYITCHLALLSIILYVCVHFSDTMVHKILSVVKITLFPLTILLSIMSSHIYMILKKKPSIWSTSIFLNPIQGFLLTNSKFLRYMCSCFIPNPYSLVKRWSLENGHCVMVGGTGSLSLSLPLLCPVLRTFLVM